MSSYRVRTIRKFTVLLLYPEYMTDGAVETYLAHVDAPDVMQAILCARMQAARDNYLLGEKSGVLLYGKDSIPVDFKVLAVFDGHLVDLKDEGWRNANEQEVENV